MAWKVHLSEVAVTELSSTGLGAANLSLPELRDSEPVLWPLGSLLHEVSCIMFKGGTRLPFAPLLMVC